MRRIRDFVDRETLSSIYNALIRPHFDYCSEVWDSLGVGLSNRLQKLQNRAARIIMNLRYNTPGIEAINALEWEPLETRRAKSKVKQMYKVLNDLAPKLSLYAKEQNMILAPLPHYNYLFQKLKTLRKASVMMELNCGNCWQIHYQH